MGTKMLHIAAFGIAYLFHITARFGIGQIGTKFGIDRFRAHTVDDLYGSFTVVFVERA